jgi:hypothetical protein
MDMDVRDLECIGKALDALEQLHDFEAPTRERVRDCLCSDASAWRQARNVFVNWRRQLGLPVRLLDQV